MFDFNGDMLYRNNNTEQIYNFICDEVSQNKGFIS